MVAAPTQLKFINKAEEEFFAEAVIGEETKQFLNSSVGRFLHGCAKQEYDRCRDEMFDTDVYTPEGKKVYLKLKADAWAASHFMQWCVETINTGNEAAVMLQTMREGEDE